MVAESRWREPQIMSYTDLIDPDNCVCLMIDHNIGFGMGVGSRDRQEVHNGTVALARVCGLYGVPLVVTNNAESQIGGPLFPAFSEVIGDTPVIAREPLTMNSWEDSKVLAAVQKTGRKKLILAGLWTEICVLYPALNAVKDGYDVYVVTDASGGSSAEAHEMALRRMANAGVAMTTWISFACELQRSWDRTKTVPGLAEIIVDHCGNWGDLLGYYSKFAPAARSPG
jgi:nicotinamidase-related amidase